MVKKQPEANEATKSLLERCQELKNNGDNTVTPLLQRLSQAQEAQILETVRYHSDFDINENDIIQNRLISSHL